MGRLTPNITWQILILLFPRAIYHHVSLAPWPLYWLHKVRLTTHARQQPPRDSEPLKYRDSSTPPFQHNFRDSRCFLGVFRYYISWVLGVLQLSSLGDACPLIIPPTSRLVATARELMPMPRPQARWQKRRQLSSHQGITLRPFQIRDVGDRFEASVG